MFLHFKISLRQDPTEKLVNIELQTISSWLQVPELKDFVSKTTGSDKTTGSE